MDKTLLRSDATVGDCNATMHDQPKIKIPRIPNQNLDGELAAINPQPKAINPASSAHAILTTLFAKISICRSLIVSPQPSQRM